MLHRPAPISSNIGRYIIPVVRALHVCVERNHNTPPALNVYNAASSSGGSSQGTSCSRCGFSDQFGTMWECQAPLRALTEREVGFLVTTVSLSGSLTTGEPASGVSGCCSFAWPPLTPGPGPPTRQPAVC